MTKMVETCHMYLAIINAITDAVAQSAVEHSGENLFRVEAQLLRKLQQELPLMISMTEEAAMLGEGDGGDGPQSQ